MSVQYGRWNFQGHPGEAFDFAKAQTLIAPYGPDGVSFHCAGDVEIAYGAFHTTRESRAERQPHAGPGGVVISWDGRLDNREQLIRCLRNGVASDSTDVQIVAAAYEKWGSQCFARILGDWALSIWNPRQSTLILAKDVVGTRPLFYTLSEDAVSWSSLLDPLVLFGGQSFPLDEEYIAGWFSFFPATRLTPYSGIVSVPPASYVLVSNKRAVCQEYWKFDPAHSVRYATDEEYEEHFRSVFSTSIRRRLRADAPVTAELSGGMDSSSIVCLADDLIAHSESNYPRLDTVSYYDDADANWDERPFFSAVEERRGRAGCHLSVDVSSAVAIPRNPPEFRATPASSCPSSSQATRFTEYFAERRSRVLLSGVGGDEVLGGVPTPIPELADLLAFGKFLPFARRTTEWALAIRKPWIFLALETARRFLPPGVRKLPLAQTPPQWLKKEFVERHHDALGGYERRLVLSGVRPTFQVNMFLLEGLRRQISCIPICCEPLLDTRYPYLDRELLQFLYATPREQMVRPHQRRSLMRRALTQTVPSLVLSRRRKAAASRSPLAAIGAQCESLLTENPHWESARLGIVDQNTFIVSVQKALSGENLPLFQLIRTLTLESWLRGFTGGPRPTVLTFPPGCTSTIRKTRNNADLGGRDELRLPAGSALRRRGLLHFLS